MSEPIRILFTIPNFITAGSGLAMLNIIKRLDRSRFAPVVCAMKKGGELDGELERLGIPLIEAPFVVADRPYHTLLARCWRAAQAFRPHRFQIWHSFHWANDWTEPIIARMAGVRCWIYTKKNMGWGRRGYLRAMLATRIVALNADMLKGFFYSRVLGPKARLIPRGVDTFRFAPNTVPRLGVRQGLGLGDNVITLSCVANLVPIKDHPTVLRAIAELPMVHFILAGKELDKEYVASLRGLVQALRIADRAHFLGPVPDVPALLAETDIFVLPTKSPGEGCPVSLLEGMSCAKPCVATDVSGSRDIIEHEKNGLLVPPGDSQAMAQAFQTLISSPDLRQRLGNAARERVVQYFSIEREIAAHEALYAEFAK
jgi:glycosyltransferase involved in cell wall biosynthesis